jgi:hypothetical protein
MINVTASLWINVTTQKLTHIILIPPLSTSTFSSSLIFLLCTFFKIETIFIFLSCACFCCLCLLFGGLTLNNYNIHVTRSSYAIPLCLLSIIKEYLDPQKWSFLKNKEKNFSNANFIHLFTDMPVKCSVNWGQWWKTAQSSLLIHTNEKFSKTFVYFFKIVWCEASK